MSSYTISLLIILLLICIFRVARRFLRHTQLLLPPGPKGTFFYGVKNLIPATTPWKTYANWAAVYKSPIISFRVYNKRIVVLNTQQSIHDLLDIRSNLYSDRPKAWMYHVLCGRQNSVFNISSLDERHKKYRRLLQSGLGARATETYWPLLESELQNLLHGFAASPENYEKHIRRNAAAVIMKMAYGYTITNENDFFIGVAEEAAQISGWAMAPGRWLVDYYPIVRYIPSWFPGAHFKRQGAAWRRRLEDLSDVPHNWVKSQMASGTHDESFTSRHLRSDGKSLIGPEEESIVKWAAGGLYAGATDTTTSAIISFVLLMSLHPEVQNKAQAEVDQVTGRDSELSKASDLPKLSYLLAVLKEVLRYAPIANLALPHRVIEADVYEGYLIPEDATVVANVWAVMHDPATYPNPHLFDPDRFLIKSNDLNTVQPDPRSFSFGFGRRACPGVQFAETTLLLTMAGILSKFNIALPDRSVVPKVEFTTAITSHIKPFDITITPRT